VRYAADGVGVNEHLRDSSLLGCGPKIPL
jgi:hypothetical protein